MEDTDKLKAKHLPDFWQMLCIYLRLDVKDMVSPATVEGFFMGYQKQGSLEIL